MQEIPATEDSFERARKAFFETGRTRPKANAPSIEFPKPRNERLVRAARNSGVNDYSGVLLSSHTEIRQLREISGRLMQQDETMLDPEFFIASLSKGWRPRVVVVTRARDVVGIMYTKERIISGIPTGIAYADGSLGGFMLGSPLYRQAAFRIAVETLLSSRRIRGVRLRVLRYSGELEAVRQLVRSRSVDVQYSLIEHNESPLWKYHAHLPMAHSYDRFLNGLGSATRHNFRYYRRRFERSGHRFIELLSVDELRSAVLDLVSKSNFTAQWQRADIERSLNMVTAASRPLAVGLKHRNGEWLGVIGGWYRPHGAVLYFQCNNERAFGADSLSVVLRAYLIELLIQQGLEELVIWADTGPPLSRYVSYTPTVGIRLDVPTYSWRVARSLISTIASHLPRRLAAVGQWIA